MPPQGESTGICIEDSIVFARTMMHHPTHDLPAIFHAYESLRRPRIDAAYDEASWRWETVKDSGWLAHKLKMWALPWVLWWMEKGREEAFAEDFTELDVEIVGEKKKKKAG